MKTPENFASAADTTNTDHETLEESALRLIKNLKPFILPDGKPVYAELKDIIRRLQMPDLCSNPNCYAFQVQHSTLECGTTSSSSDEEPEGSEMSGVESFDYWKEVEGDDEGEGEGKDEGDNLEDLEPTIGADMEVEAYLSDDELLAPQNSPAPSRQSEDSDADDETDDQDDTVTSTEPLMQRPMSIADHLSQQCDHPGCICNYRDGSSEQDNTITSTKPTWRRHLNFEQCPYHLGNSMCPCSISDQMVVDGTKNAREVIVVSD